MRAVGYFREPSASTVKAQGGHAESISQQNRRFLDYCEVQGYDVATTFAEESGSPGGPAFTQLIEYLKRPEKGFMIVVSPRPANLADDTVVAAARCLQVERLGARLQFIDSNGGVKDDPLDSIVKSWSSSRGEEVREKVKAALRRKAVRGEVLGRPPYGYRVGPRNRLEVVDDEAVVVRYIFRLYLHEGLGIRLIARRLNEEGLLTRRNRPWSMVSIRDILRNRAYLGTYQRLGVRVPGTHPALASPDDFRRVQERLSDRRTNFSPRNVSGFLLSGLVICDNCGNRMNRGQPSSVMDAPQRRQRAGRLLSLLSVRVSHQSGHLQLQHATRRRAGRRRPAATQRARSQQAGDRRKRRCRDFTVAGRVAAAT